METEALTLQSATPFSRVPKDTAASLYLKCAVCVYTSVNVLVFTLGDNEGHFLMDKETGEMKLIHGFRDRLTTPALHIKVMVRLAFSVSLAALQDINPTAFSFCPPRNQAYQDDDPRKYSVATVLIHVLAVNHFYPEFDKTEYQGFVHAGNSLASLVNTYGSKVLMLHVQDQDFNHVCTPNTQTHTRTAIKMLKAVLYWIYTVTHQLFFFFFFCHKLIGFQSHDQPHLQPYIKLHRHVPNHTGGSTDRQDQSTQTKAETYSQGEPQ